MSAFKNKDKSLSISFLFILILFLGSSTRVNAFPMGIPASYKSPRTKLGNDEFLRHFPSELRGKRLGLVINHTSHLSGGKSFLQALLDKGEKIAAIFSPEHGFRGEVEQGIAVENGRLKTIKIYSLYGKTKKPTALQMREVDAFIYDIQDIGTRFYTYITTLKYVIQAAAEADKPVYILDRPNPAGGLIIEGPLLISRFESFIGAFPIPIRHGLTAGELALMMKGEGWIDGSADLHVIQMKGWSRKHFWRDTGLDWIPTSPNIPTAETALFFPGTGLLGGLILNQGLGTDLPFLQLGAPWIDPERLIHSLKGGKDFGVKMEAVSYTPRSLPGKSLHPPYEARLCHGVRIHVLEAERFMSIRFTLALIKALKEDYASKLAPVSRSLNLMFGTDLLQRYLEGKITYEEMLERMREDEDFFRKQRRKYLLYE